MSERVDNFCNDLRDHLNAVEARLSEVKASVQSSATETQEAVEAKKKEIEASFKAEEQKVEDAKAKAKNWFEAKAAETEAEIENWKTQREIHKLEKRAGNAEDYAATAIIIAAAAVDEAEIAILDAVSARLLAEATASA